MTITYTDVHLERLLFFQDMFSAWGVVWEDTRSRSDQAIEGGLFHLVVGGFAASTDDRPGAATSSTSAPGWCSSSTGTALASDCGGWSGTGAAVALLRWAAGQRLRPHGVSARRR